MNSKNFSKRSTRQKIYDNCRDKLTQEELYMVLFSFEPIDNAHKIWNDLYELPLIEKDESFEEKFESAFIGQKRTSKAKPLAFIFPKFVYKGPYNLKQTKTKLRNILFRQDFLLLLGDDVPSPIKLYQINDSRVYLRMPRVGKEEVNWKTETSDILGEEKQRQIVTKESQGIQEFLQYLKNGGKDTEIIYKSLLHYIHRVICDPVIGDPALRNILIVNDDVVCIDFEDNRGNIDYDSSIFEILGGKASWATKNVLELFSRVLYRKNEDILQHLKNIDIEEIEKLINQHQIADLVSIDNIKDRIEKMTEVVNGYSRNEEDESTSIETKSMAGAETKMFYKHNNSISRHGHTQDALISALQKYIRRGELRKAQYVGLELFLFNSIPEAKALVTRFINRLRVILPEDTSGISSPRLAIVFNKYYLRTLKGVLSMIYLLVKSPKIRLISDIKMVFFSDIFEKAKDYSYFNKLYASNLKEIDAEYKLKKGDDPKLQKIANGIVTGIKNKSDNGFYWLAKLVDYVELGIDAAPRSINKTRANNHPMYLAFEIYYEYANRGENLWDDDQPIVKDKLLIETLNICFNWYKDFGLKKKTTKSPKETSHRDWIVFVIWPALYCFREIDWDKNIPVDPNYSDDDIERIVNKLSKPMELDDYVFDKHTKKGKQMGRGAMHFAEEGALVANEDTELLNKYYRRLYLDIRK